MTTQFKNYTVDIIDESNFSLESTDNALAYDKVYFDEGEYQATSKHGIKVSKEGMHVSSAIICEVGGATGIYDNSFVIKDDSLLICCCDTIYSFKLPELALNWKKEFDMATCFSIYLFRDDFIIHGETQITRIDYNGNKKWDFTARDIFVTPDGKESIKIKVDEIYLRDWQGYEYLLNENGKEMR
jgi:hypothetical protein